MWMGESESTCTTRADPSRALTDDVSHLSLVSQRTGRKRRQTFSSRSSSLTSLARLNGCRYSSTSC